LERVNGWKYNTEDRKYEAEYGEGEEETDYERKKKKKALLKEMTPSWFTECQHWQQYPCA